MKGAMAKGAAWMLLFKLAERSLGFVSLLILARLLVPADFGLIAMAVSVTAFIELASAFGFELALIQREQLTREHYDTAWTLQIMFGVGCAFATAAAAYPAALFYDEPRLVPVMLVLAGGWLIQSFENIGVVDFRRKMDFARDFAFLASKKVVAFTVTITLALLFKNYWALVAGTIAGRLAGLSLSYMMQPFRPRFSFSKLADLFSFSTWVAANNFVAFGSERLSHFVIGRVHGASALGLYTVASEIAYLPATQFVAPINRALFPGYSRMAGSIEWLRQGYSDVLAMIALIALPMSFGIAAIADPMIRALLGEKWIEARAVIQVLAFAGAFHAVSSNCWSVWLALGKARTNTMIGLFHLVTLIVSLLVFSSMFGWIGIAYAELVSFALSVLLAFVILSRDLQLPLRSYVTCFWRPLLAATIMGFSIQMTLPELGEGAAALGPLTQLIIVIPLGALLYVCSVGLLWVLAGSPRGPEAELLERARALTLRWWPRRKQVGADG